MTPVELVLAKFPQASRSGNGWIDKCPAHEDQRASLSIGEGDDGRALLKCFAGCTFEAVCDAISLSPARLMPSGGVSSAVLASVNVNGIASFAEKTSIPLTELSSKSPTRYLAAGAAIADLERQHGPASAKWEYPDAEGSPLGVVVRWDLL